MQIFIRADGGETIGLGHIMRMLVLAEELIKNNKVIFICKSSNAENSLKKISSDNYLTFNLNNDKFKAGIEKIIKNGFEILMIREEYVIDDIIALQKEYAADLIITDSYDVDEEYFNRLKKVFKISGYMDDVNKCKMNVDFIINQNINAEDIDYKSNINKCTKLFLGTKYCLIRKEFRENYDSKIIKEKAEDALLTLGGMDRDHNTIKIINEILDYNINIHVVVGGAFEHKLIHKLYELSKRFSNVIIYENANMSSLMKKCDIAISACGSTLYELCAINIPTIGIIIADNQELVAKKMKEKSLIVEYYYINELKNGRLKFSLNKLINDKALRNQIINNQSDAVNINGAQLLCHNINKLILSSDKFR